MRRVGPVLCHIRRKMEKDEIAPPWGGSIHYWDCKSMYIEWKGKKKKKKRCQDDSVLVFLTPELNYSLLHRLTSGLNNWELSVETALVILRAIGCYFHNSESWKICVILHLSQNIICIPLSVKWNIR